jgi:flavin reductase (DIM6/NTAB) family NADH-FMN oxidoreductase RutF
VKKINPKEVSPAVLHGYLLGTIAPRPIAFVSTIDLKGNVNLSPFSYFNIFGTNPPTLIFSPARRIRGNTNKHTLENILEVKEAVINIVNYPMVEQMSLASTEYGKGVNEFKKAGFTPIASEMVKPPRVEQSPASFECIVKEVVETGKEGGAGNLIICEIVLAHINENIFDEEGKIDPYKLDAVARMGGDYYCHAQGDAIFKIKKPTRYIGIGMDQLSEHILNSKVLSGNNLAQLAGVESLPTAEEVELFKQGRLFQEFSPESVNEKELENKIHVKAKECLDSGDVHTAWLFLLQLVC